VFIFSRLVHGANGYLITQFLDSTANQRTDKWGGSVENRSRFGLEVLKELTKVFGRDVGVKLNPAGGYNDVGYVFKNSSSSVRGMNLTCDRMPLQETLGTSTSLPKPTS
jgi:2,4-dienoyl-CoA reductase-like NADH-dependent reductase (Old Yellow Enzyme family)